MSYYTSMALGPLERSQVPVLLQGKLEEPEEYTPMQNLVKTEALKGGCYRDQSSCIHLQGVSSNYPENN